MSKMWKKKNQQRKMPRITYSSKHNQENKKRKKKNKI
jgi:hypothetical protein